MVSSNKKNELINTDESSICSAGFLRNSKDYVNNGSVTSLESTILAEHLSELKDEIENTVSERTDAITSDNEYKKSFPCDEYNFLNVNIDALSLCETY